jgi:serine/threonine-protein kinase RsbW
MLKRLKIESDIANLTIVENEIETLINENGIDKDNYGKILVSVMEAVNNAIIHGNKNNVKKSVEVEIELIDDCLKVIVTDEGNGFVPGNIPDPTKPENIESVNGRGVFLMSKLADNIEFNEKGNSVKMTFKNVYS